MLFSNSTRVYMVSILGGHLVISYGTLVRLFKNYQPWILSNFFEVVCVQLCTESVTRTTYKSQATCPLKGTKNVLPDFSIFLQEHRSASISTFSNYYMSIAPKGIFIPVQPILQLLLHHPLSFTLWLPIENIDFAKEWFFQSPLLKKIPNNCIHDDWKWISSNHKNKKHFVHLARTTANHQPDQFVVRRRPTAKIHNRHICVLGNGCISYNAVAWNQCIWTS